MKKLVRGQFARSLSILLLISMMVPSMLLPALSRVSAQDSGRQTIWLLPFSAKSGNAPTTLPALAKDQLRDVLKLRSQVTVLELSRNSAILRRAKDMMDESSQQSFMESFDVAMSPKAGDTERANAAANVLSALDSVSFAVIGNIDGYQIEKKTGRREILIKMTAVSVDKDASGRTIYDAQGNIKPIRTPYTAIGHSQLRPGNQTSVQLQDNEALADATNNLATKITGMAAEAPANTSSLPSYQPEVKTQGGGSKMRWVWPAFLVVGLVAALNGKGGDNSTPPPPPPAPVLLPPANLNAKVMVQPNGSLGITLTWNMPTLPAGAPKPTSFDIYRVENPLTSSAWNSTAFVKGLNPLLTANIKSSTGHPLSGHSLSGARGSESRPTFREIHRNVPSLALPTRLPGTPYDNVTVKEGVNAYFYQDKTVDFGKTYLYEVLAVYTGGTSVPATKEKTIGVQTPEVTDLTATYGQGVSLTWNAPSGVTTGKTFKIYRSTNAILSTVSYVLPDNLSSYGFTLLNSVSWADTNSYLDSTAASGKTYFYAVSWVNTSDVESSGPFKVCSVTTPASEDSILSLLVISKEEIDLSWPPDDQATSYRLQRATDPTSESSWFTINEGTATTYADKTSLKPGTRYYYRLLEQIGSAWHEYGTPVSGMTFPAAPKLTDVIPIDANETNVTWATVTGALYYLVERADNGGAFAIIGIVDADTLSLTQTSSDTSIKTGASSIYRVVASNDLNNYGADGEPGTKSDEKTVLQYPGVIDNFKRTATGITSMSFSWDAEPSAPNVTMEYIVERTGTDPVEDPSNWSAISTQTATTITDSTLTSATEYWYRVKTKNTTGTTTSEAFGPFMTNPQAAQIITPITILGSSSVKLSWTSISRAIKYTILRKMHSDDIFITVGTVDKPDGLGGILQEFTDDNGGTGLLASTTYDYKLITSSLPSGAGSSSSVVSVTTPSGPPTPNNSLYVPTINVVPGKFNRLYYSNADQDQLALFAETTTELVLTGYNSDKTTPAAGAEVTLYTDKGTFEAKTVGQALGLNKKSISGILDANGQMTVVYMGRPSDSTASFWPTQSELGPVKFTAGIVGGSPVDVSFLNIANDQPVLVGPPTSIVMQPITAPSYPIAQPNDGFPIVFQKDTIQVSAKVTDALAQPVIAGTPIWFAQTWTKLTSLDPSLGGVDYNYNAWGAANFASNSVKSADANGMVTIGFASNHSGVYKVRAYATIASKDVDVPVLDAINTDTTPGGMPLNSAQASAAVKSNLLLDGLGNTVESAPVSILNKTFVYYDRWYKVGTAGVPTHLNCNGDLSTALTFTANDQDGKRVLPGTYYQAGPKIIDPLTMTWVVSGTLQDKNNNPANETYQGFDQNSQTTLLVRGTHRVGKFGITFNTQGKDQTLWTYDRYDLVTFTGPDLNKIYDSEEVGWQVMTVDNAYLVSYWDDSACQIPRSSTLRVTLKDQDSNPFPAGVLVKLKGSKANIGFNAEGLTDNTGKCSFTYLSPDLNNLGVDTIIDQIQLTVISDTEVQDNQTRNTWWENWAIETQHPSIGSISPHFGTPEPLIGVNTPILIDSWVSASSTYVHAGFPVRYYLETDNSSMNASLSSYLQFTNGGGSLPTITLNTGSVYGRARVILYYDKYDVGANYPPQSEWLDNTGWFVIGIATPYQFPVGVDVLTGKPYITWSHVADNYGYQVERSTDGITFTTLTSTAQNVENYIDASAAANTTYYYQVRAIDYYGHLGNQSNIQSTTTGAIFTIPAVPTGLKATGQTTSSITLTWTAVTGATSYIVQRYDDTAGAPGVYVTLPEVSGTTITDIGLVSGHEYGYQIAAKNVIGTSAFSTPLVLHTTD